MNSLKLSGSCRYRSQASVAATILEVVETERILESYETPEEILMWAERPTSTSVFNIGNWCGGKPTRGRRRRKARYARGVLIFLPAMIVLLSLFRPSLRASGAYGVTEASSSILSLLDVKPMLGVLSSLWLQEDTFAFLLLSSYGMIIVFAVAPSPPKDDAFAAGYAV
eukprot:CAMPEP_0198730126 /NCGR_PEP_ID=MMETSP1475-20131203/22962_1 /TAXON_ID= ORGANISM="Unidentified sp., Strain CCMP1999" /NCGR_SAMPLE_ID=MMETSP1475 /ASSEMBLY_ACC=CAM_ASM_001111 /LENGTH=167 /DNA_ID=CAMNT_0044492897 /DNA_START=168 /DNA_END=672 /DNA_ORIENTATION=-